MSYYCHMENNTPTPDRKPRTYTLADDAIHMLMDLRIAYNERTISGTIERLIREAHAELRNQDEQMI